jgi:hypothetical protein
LSNRLILFSKTNGTIFIIYFLDSSNQYHQWTFDKQTPRSKIEYDLSTDDYTSIMIIPGFDYEVDLGRYQCLATNIYGTTTRDIILDKKTLKSKQRRLN